MIGSWRRFVATVDERTPPHRDRGIDALRAGSLVAVVLGHWLVTAVRWDAGALVQTSPLAYLEFSWVLTWVFNVMPIFFFVGGFSNAVAWDAVRRGGGGYRTYMGRRAGRLLLPTAAFLVPWAVGCALALLLGAAWQTVASTAWLAVQPLWFVVIYLGAIAAAPAMLALHRRLGVAVPVLLVAATAANDLARFALWPELPAAVGYLNLATVWLAAQQLGFFLAERRSRRSHGAAFALGGLLALALLVGVLGYPASMVGVTGEARSNMNPPSAALAALTFVQVGVVLVARERLARALARPVAWALAVAANLVAMTLFLWHQTAMLAVSAAVSLVAPAAPGLLEPPREWSWVGARLAWLPAFALVLAGLVAVFARIEGHARKGRVRADRPSATSPAPPTRSEV